MGAPVAEISPAPQKQAPVWVEGMGDVCVCVCVARRFSQSSCHGLTVASIPFRQPARGFAMGLFSEAERNRLSIAAAIRPWRGGVVREAGSENDAKKRG